MEFGNTVDLADGHSGLLNRLRACEIRQGHAIFHLYNV